MCRKQVISCNDFSKPDKSIALTFNDNIKLRNSNCLVYAIPHFVSTDPSKCIQRNIEDFPNGLKKAYQSSFAESILNFEFRQKNQTFLIDLAYNCINRYSCIMHR